MCTSDLDMALDVKDGTQLYNAAEEAMKSELSDTLVLESSMDNSAACRSARPWLKKPIASMVTPLS